MLCYDFVEWTSTRRGRNILESKALVLPLMSWISQVKKKKKNTKMHVRFQKNTDVTAEHVRLRKHKRDSSLSTLALTLPSVPDGQNKHIQESRGKKKCFHSFLE